MRIIHVVSDDDRRGGQVFAHDLSTALQQLGHDSVIMALQAGATGGLGVNHRWKGRFRPATLVDLRKAMDSADVTVAHGSSTLLACAVASVVSSRPFVARQISETRFWANTPSRRTRVRWYHRRATRIVALSESSATTLEEYLGVPRDKIRIVPNGVPVGSFGQATPAQVSSARSQLGLADERFTLAYIGALVPEKGVDIAIRCLERLPEAQLLIAGAGPERERLELLAAKSGVQARVVLAGSLEDPVVAYHSADLVVLPSRGGDSMPAVLIEAGFCGLPAVTTNVGAITDVVIDDMTGRVVAPSDEQAFVTAVVDLGGDGPSRAEMGTAARLHCLDHFEIGVVARAWEAVLVEAAQLRR